MKNLWTAMAVSALFGVTSFGATITGLLFGGEPRSDNRPTFSFTVGGNTLSGQLSGANAWATSPILLTNPLNPSPTANIFSVVNLTNEVQFPIRFNGNIIAPGSYVLSMQFNMAAWTGGTITDTTRIRPNNDPPDWSYRIVTPGSTTFTGTIDLRDSSGTCLICDSFTGTATVGGEVVGTLFLANSWTRVRYDITGQSIPEPSAGALAVGGLGVLLAFRHRMRR